MRYGVFGRFSTHPPRPFSFKRRGAFLPSLFKRGAGGEFKKQHILYNVSQILWILLIFTIPLPAQKYAAFIPEFKLNPLTGELVGSLGEDVASLEKRFNLIDASGRIDLRAAGGETMMLQLLTPPDPALRIRINNPAGLPLRIYQVGVVRSPEREEPLPDILLPLRREGEHLAPVRDAVLIPAESKYFLFWVECDIPSELGGSTVVVQLHLEGAAPRNLPVRIEVQDARLPDPPVRIDFNEYGDKYLQVFREDFPDSAQRRIERKVFNLCRDHHGSINPLPYKSQRGEPREGMAPQIVNADLLHPQLDWQEFDARFGPYFDGSAFPDGRPIDHFYLPFNPDWPAPFPLYLSDRPRYEQIWRAVAQEFLRHFREKGWTATTFQVYCNQKPTKGGGVPWHLDEPKSVRDYEALRYYHDLTQQAFAGSEPLAVKFRIDISHFYCDAHQGSKDKDFRVNGGGEILDPVEVWVISRHSMYDAPAIRAAQQLRREGKEVWVYAETPKLDEGGEAALQRIYHTWEHGFNGIMIWRSFARELHENKGSKFILYAVSAGGEKDIYPSLRVKLLKRGIDDTRLFEAALARGHLSKAEITDFRRSLEIGDPEALWYYRNHLHLFVFDQLKLGNY